MSYFSPNSIDKRLQLIPDVYIYIYIYTNPSARAGYYTRSIFKRS